MQLDLEEETGPSASWSKAARALKAKSQIKSKQAKLIEKKKKERSYFQTFMGAAQAIPDLHVGDDGKLAWSEYAPVEVTFDRNWLWPHLLDDRRFESATIEGHQLEGGYLPDSVVERMESVGYRDIILADRAEAPGFSMAGREGTLLYEARLRPHEIHRVLYEYWVGTTKNCIEFALEFFSGYVKCGWKVLAYLRNSPDGCRPTDRKSAIVNDPDKDDFLTPVERVPAKVNPKVIPPWMRKAFGWNPTNLKYSVGVSPRSNDIMDVLCNSSTSKKRHGETGELQKVAGSIQNDPDFTVPLQGGAPDYLMGFDGLEMLIKNDFIPFEAFLIQSGGKTQYEYESVWSYNPLRAAQKLWENVAKLIPEFGGRRAGHAGVALVFKHKIERTVDPQTGKVRMRYVTCSKRWGCIFGANPQQGGMVHLQESWSYCLWRRLQTPDHPVEGELFFDPFKLRKEKPVLTTNSHMQWEFQRRIAEQAHDNQKMGRVRIEVFMDNHIGYHRTPNKYMRIKSETFYHPDWRGETAQLRARILKSLAKLNAINEIPVQELLATYDHEIYPEDSAFWERLKGVGAVEFEAGDADQAAGRSSWEVQANMNPETGGGECGPEQRRLLNAVIGIDKIDDDEDGPWNAWYLYCITNYLRRPFDDYKENRDTSAGTRAFSKWDYRYHTYEQEYIDAWKLHKRWLLYRKGRGRRSSARLRGEDPMEEEEIQEEQERLDGDVAEEWKDWPGADGVEYEEDEGEECAGSDEDPAAREARRLASEEIFASCMTSPVLQRRVVMFKEYVKRHRKDEGGVGGALKKLAIFGLGNSRQARIAAERAQMDQNVEMGDDDDDVPQDDME